MGSFYFFRFHPRPARLILVMERLCDSAFITRVFFCPLPSLLRFLPWSDGGVFFLSLMNYPQTQESHLFKMPPILTQHQPAPHALFYQSFFPNPPPPPHTLLFRAAFKQKKGRTKALCPHADDLAEAVAQSKMDGARINKASGQNCRWTQHK